MTENILDRLRVLRPMLDELESRKDTAKDAAKKASKEVLDELWPADIESRYKEVSEAYSLLETELRERALQGENFGKIVVIAEEKSVTVNKEAAIRWILRALIENFLIQDLDIAPDEFEDALDKWMNRIGSDFQFGLLGLEAAATKRIEDAVKTRTYEIPDGVAVYATEKSTRVYPKKLFDKNEGLLS